MYVLPQNSRFNFLIENFDTLAHRGPNEPFVLFSPLLQEALLATIIGEKTEGELSITEYDLSALMEKLANSVKEVFSIVGGDELLSTLKVICAQGVGLMTNEELTEHGQQIGKIFSYFSEGVKLFNRKTNSKISLSSTHLVPLLPEMLFHLFDRQYLSDRKNVTLAFPSTRKIFEKYYL